MQLTTTLLAAITGLASLTTATPLAKRDCHIQYPQAIGFPIRYNVSESRPNAVNFMMPPDAQGSCNLALIFPQGYTGISHAGPTDTVNFVDKNGTVVANFAAIRSWPSQPADAYQVGYRDVRDHHVVYDAVSDHGSARGLGCL